MFFLPSLLGSLLFVCIQTWQSWSSSILRIAIVGHGHFITCALFIVAPTVSLRPWGILSQSMGTWTFHFLILHNETSLDVFQSMHLFQVRVHHEHVPMKIWFKTHLQSNWTHGCYQVVFGFRMFRTNAIHLPSQTHSDPNRVFNRSPALAACQRWQQRWRGWKPCHQLMTRWLDDYSDVVCLFFWMMMSLLSMSQFAGFWWWPWWCSWWWRQWCFICCCTFHFIDGWGSITTHRMVPKFILHLLVPKLISETLTVVTIEVWTEVDIVFLKSLSHVTQPMTSASGWWFTNPNKGPYHLDFPGPQNYPTLTTVLYPLVSHRFTRLKHLRLCWDDISMIP